MEIFFVRHGDFDNSKDEKNLTEKGFDQAKQLAKELSKHSFSKIYSSNLLRAKQTCEVFTKDYAEDERLREIYRVIVGGPIREGTPKERELKNRERADEAFDSLKKEAGKILVFCHGNLIRYYLNKVLKSEENLWGNMEISNCSISILEIEGNKLRIKKINSESHLK